MAGITKIGQKNNSLIGISGKIGSGKDTCTQIIQWLSNDGLQERFTIEDYIDFCKTNGTPGLSKIPSFDGLYLNCKFAFKIKQIVSILTGISMEDLEKPEIKASYLPECWNKTKLRINYSKISNGFYERTPFNERMTVREFMQKLGTDALKNIVHPNIWINALYSDFKPECKYIISDVRFIDEAKSVIDRNGLLLRINRDIQINHDYKNHISETQLDEYNNFDVIIDNSGNINDLTNQIKNSLFS